VDELLDKIASQAARAGDVLGRLRSMLKKHEPEASEIDLGRLVSDVVKLVEIGPQPDDLRVEVAIATDLPRVIADGIQIQQVVLNLARNGVEAMASAGVPGPRLLLAVERSTDSDLVVRVSDNGPGIAPDQTERIFEPFYSTKQTGLGIGLAICRTIGGALSCTPGVNGGAVFQFTLPVAGSEA
jgi:C4-dicarboxylate-specific signal transduction histidine kinase